MVAFTLYPRPTWWHSHCRAKIRRHSACCRFMFGPIPWLSLSLLPTLQLLFPSERTLSLAWHPRRRTVYLTKTHITSIHFHSVQSIWPHRSLAPSALFVCRILPYKSIISSSIGCPAQCPHYIICQSNSRNGEPLN